ncbi:MAG: nicotinate-nucleotide--dimethylbenzimidazole phosphoribosyltransferase [Clostridia bacterium]|nr:nicotinate-nucleotide--dimethylbenzimidazole phosphoribosyltransferase [Clostridia bacterium]
MNAIEKMKEQLHRIKPISAAMTQEAENRVNSLIKPKGSLGDLEKLYIQLAGIQNTLYPSVEKKAVIVCAGDHGVIAEGVATSKKDITLIQANNMMRGVTGVCALSRQVGAEVVVVDVGIDAPDEKRHPEMINKNVMKGSNNFYREKAMSYEQAIQSVQAGIDVALQKVSEGVQLLGTGEMGIGNTTPSAAIVSVITGATPEAVTGVGANLPLEKLAHKVTVVKESIAKHAPNPADGFDVLSKVGGLEIGGMAGVMIGGAMAGVPVVVDGFISTAAAVIACTIEPKVRDYLIASHGSMEPGARIGAEHLNFKQYLQLDMRLGEGTGAVLMFNIIDAACHMNRHMLTFEEAGFIVD